VGFAQSGFGGRLSAIDLPAGKAHLTAMVGEIRLSNGQRDRRPGHAGINQHQRRRTPGVVWHQLRPPARPQGPWRKSALRFGAWQGLCQARANDCLERTEVVEGGVHQDEVYRSDRPDSHRAGVERKVLTP